ncbi:hypothetical protein [Mycetocola reblochoni]|uniref:Translation initiation factor 2 n=1 Tax=Mycetocola reblochoni REB411 TaxID=1255698 RepID=A0A1R4I895_9MICO|nr:hypothetical protein [Mycetocola reblochoni]SJN15916.1 Translation initiation factor 2 [Mycetocola reblochoni REB411]
MSPITVERTDGGIVVAEANEARDAAATLLDGLPPLSADRYLVAHTSAGNALASPDGLLLDTLRPLVGGRVVVPAAGFAAAEGDEDPAAARLASALGVPVVAPTGRFIRAEGALFAVGGGDGWVAHGPDGTRTGLGRRQPAPSWQSGLAPRIDGCAHIPAGIWATAGSPRAHALTLARVAVRSGRMLLVVGSPAEPAPSVERLAGALRALPPAAADAAVLVGYGRHSLTSATVRALADELARPIRVAHGVEMNGRVVRLDAAPERFPGTLALESVCAPHGEPVLERWTAPAGLAERGGGVFALAPGWVAQAVPQGVIVRPVSDAPDITEADATTLPDALAVFVHGDGGDLSCLAGPLGRMVDELGARTTVRVIPRDDPARRMLVDELPRLWAPSVGLAMTDDGRIIAAETVPDGDGEPGTGAERGPGAEPGARTGAAPAGGGRRGARFAGGGSAPAAARPSGGADDVLPRTAAGVEPVLVVAEWGAVVAVAEQKSESESDPDPDPEPEPDLDPHPNSESDATPAPRTQRAGAGESLAGALRGRSSTGVPRSEGRSRPAPVPAPVPAASDHTMNALAMNAPATTADSADRSARPALADAAVLGEQARSGAAGAVAARHPSHGVALSAPGSASSVPTPAPRSASSVPTPAPRSASSVPTPAPRSASSVPTPAPRSASSVPTPAPRSASSVPTPASRPASAAPTSATPAAAQPSAEPPPAPAPDPAAVPDTASTAGSRAAPPATEAASAGLSAPAPAREAAPAPAPAPAREAAPVPAPEATPADPTVPRDLGIPTPARSTPEQRHRVRAALGPRYDVASRTVAQLLAQQPGMRVAADRSALLTSLSLVRVFAAEPRSGYDLDFHTCLAEGLALLPTARAVVVRGLPSLGDTRIGDMLSLGEPLVSAPVDGPRTGPAEALIWTTSGRRLDRVLAPAEGGTDVVLPAHTRLRVLGTVDGPVPRLLLAELGSDEDAASTRLRAAADGRAETGGDAAVPRHADDDRWLGALPIAG